MVGSPHPTRRASLWPFKYELTHVNGAPFEYPLTLKNLRRRNGR